MRKNTFPALVAISYERNACVFFQDFCTCVEKLRRAPRAGNATFPHTCRNLEKRTCCVNSYNLYEFFKVTAPPAATKKLIGYTMIVQSCAKSALFFYLSLFRDIFASNEVHFTFGDFIQYI